MIFQNFVRAFLKAAGHRYIKRIPYTTPKGRRYRYIYRVSSTHRGRHAFDAEHLVEGTAFALHGEGESEFHGHITKVDGDTIKYVIDDGPRKGEEVTTTRAKLVAELNDVHGVQDKLTAEREKVRAAIAEAKRAGHAGVVRRLERRLRALGGEPEAQPTEPTEYGTHISEEDIATYKRIAEEGPDALADMSDDEITRLMLQHGRNVDARSRAVQDEINAARDELKHSELMRQLDRAEGRLTIHPVRQQDRDEHARLSEEFARVDAEYKRRSEEAQKRHVYTDPVLGRHDDSAHHLTMEHYERKEKREAEEERRTKGSKLYQSLNVENAKGMREKHDAEVRRQRLEAPEQRAMGSLSAIAKEFNHEDAYEIAERAIEERPRDALIVADLIQTTPDNANRISTPLTIRLAELIHGEPSPEAHSPRESHLMDIHSTLGMKEERKKNGTRTKYSKREVSEALDKLREHVRRFYPEDDPTAFAEMRGQIREAIEGVIATYEKSLAEDTKDEARIKRALERLEAISKGEIEAQPAEPTESAAPKQATQMLAELEQIKEIAKQGPSGKYRRLSASAGDYSSRNFPDLDSPAKLYQAIRDNIKNVSAEGDYTHATDQISAFLSSGALQSEQGYMLRRLLREMNPLDQSPEELRREEAEDERINRDTSDTLAAFHDLEAQPTEPEPEAQPAEPKPKPKKRETASQRRERLRQESQEILGRERIVQEETLERRDAPSAQVGKLSELPTKSRALFARYAEKPRAVTYDRGTPSKGDVKGKLKGAHVDDGKMFATNGEVIIHAPTSLADGNYGVAKKKLGDQGATKIRPARMLPELKTHAFTLSAQTVKDVHARLKTLAYTEPAVTVTVAGGNATIHVGDNIIAQLPAPSDVTTKTRINTTYITDALSTGEEVSVFAEPFNNTRLVSFVTPSIATSIIGLRHGAGES